MESLICWKNIQLTSLNDHVALAFQANLTNKMELVIPKYQNLKKQKEAINKEMKDVYEKTYKNTKSLFRGVNLTEIIDMIKSGKFGNRQKDARLDYACLTSLKDVAKEFSDNFIMEIPKESVEMNIESMGYDMFTGYDEDELGKAQAPKFFSEFEHRLLESIDYKETKGIIHVLSDDAYMDLREFVPDLEKYWEIKVSYENEYEDEEEYNDDDHQANTQQKQAGIPQQMAPQTMGNQQWQEEKHPRADDGKFGSGGGGNSSNEQQIQQPNPQNTQQNKLSSWVEEKKQKERIKYIKNTIRIAKQDLERYTNKYSINDISEFWDKFRIQDEDGYNDEFESEIMEEMYIAIEGLDDFLDDELYDRLNSISNSWHDFVRSDEFEGEEYENVVLYLDAAVHQHMTNIIDKSAKDYFVELILKN